MNDQLVNILRTQLSTIDASSLLARQGVYERVRSTVARLHGGSASSPQGIEISLALERAIELVESEYAPVNGTFVERAIHATISTVAALKSKYGVFSIVATSVSDFIKPIIDTTQPLIFLSAAAALPNRESPDYYSPSPRS